MGQPDIAEERPSFLRSLPGMVGRGLLASVRGWAGRVQWLALVVFVASRWFAHSAGVHFDGKTLSFWQLLDTEILTKDLARGIYYLHSQPPLFNLFIGVLLKATGIDHQDTAGAVIFWTLSLVGYLSAIRLLLRLGVHPALSFAVPSVFFVSPIALLYENWLFYAWPIAILLVLSASQLERFLATERRRHLVTFLVLVTITAFTRSTYHLIWVIATSAVLVYFARPGTRRTVALLASVPILLVTLLYAKNYLIVRSFSGSSWLGMSLGRMTTDKMKPAERDELIKKHILSNVARVGPFAGLSAYPKDAISAQGPTHPSLRQPVKSGVGKGPNFNHEAYVHIAELYKKDATWIILHRGGVYRKSVSDAFALALRPPTRYSWVGGNRKAIDKYERFYSKYVYGSFGKTLEQKSPTLFVCILGGLAFVAGVVRLVRGRKEKDRGMRVVAYAGTTALFVFLTSNLVEVGENDRFRVEVEPILMVVTVAALFMPWRRRAQLAEVPPPIVEEPALEAPPAEPPASPAIPGGEPGVQGLALELQVSVSLVDPCRIQHLCDGTP